MPRLASPYARSLNGLFPPIVSSRSLGPEPCTRTIAGNFVDADAAADADGNVSFPGSGHSLPTTTSISFTFDASAYDGGCHAVAGVVGGTKNNPAILPS